MVIAMLCAQAAQAAHGTGSLFVAGAAHTPTHWNISVGQSTTAEIRGVSTSEVGQPLPARIVVWIKSSVFGNTQLVATRIGVTNAYAFTYTPPSGICETSVVAYQEQGLNSNNDLLDDGIQNGSRMASAGFRFVDAAGNPAGCEVSVEQSPWGRIKALYR